MRNKPYKLYKGARGFSDYLFICIGNIYLYHKYDNRPWEKYNGTYSCIHDLEVKTITFVKNMSEKELFLELL